MSTNYARARLTPTAALALSLFSFTAACSDEPGDGTTSATSSEPEWAMEEISAERGFSLRIPSFAVPSGQEEQSCYFVRVPDLDQGRDLWVDRLRLAMNRGSHHMNVFRVRTIIDLNPDDGEPVQLGPYAGTAIHGHGDYAHHPCWGSANWADWPLVANAEVPDPPDWQLPEGVAMRFSPGEMLMIQTHYVNTTTQPTPSGLGSVGINFYRAGGDARQELGTLFATQQNIRICQNQPRPVFSGTCKFPGQVTIAAANGHFHSRGHQFRMYVWDGASIAHPAASDQFYLSDRWDDPPMTVDIDRPVSQGGGIWWDCEYRWRKPQVFGCDQVNDKDPESAGDCCYTFGGNTDVGEHCNVFLYYYPKVENTDVFCN